MLVSHWSQQNAHESQIRISSPAWKSMSKTYPSSGVQSCLYQKYSFRVTENGHLNINYLGPSSLAENKTNEVWQDEKQRNPQIRKRCAFVRPILYYFVSISQLGIKATYCINYAELFSYVTQYKKSRELIRVDLGQKGKPF